MLLGAPAPSLEKATVLTRLKWLEPFRPVVVELVRVVSEDEVKFHEIAQLIRSDAAVSAEVLRIANSPLLGSWGRVNSVLHAVVMLGLERLKGLVLTLALRNSLSRALEVPALLRCWRHNLACGVLSEHLAGMYFLPKDPCFTAGLLHDVGRLALLGSFPSEYVEALKLADHYNLDMLECERGVFGLDHCEAGEWLVEKWGFPEEFRQITGRHHEEPSAGRLDKLALVGISCRMADALGFMAAGSVPQDGFSRLAARLPVPGWHRVLSETELSVAIADKINALECGLLE